VDEAHAAWTVGGQVGRGGSATHSGWGLELGLGLWMWMWLWQSAWARSGRVHEDALGAWVPEGWREGGPAHRESVGINGRPLCIRGKVPGHLALPSPSVLDMG
jgi:hypothetical protein